MYSHGPCTSSFIAIWFYIFIERLYFATYMCCSVRPNIDLPLLLSFDILMANTIRTKYLSQELGNFDLFPCRVEFADSKPWSSFDLMDGITSPLGAVVSIPGTEPPSSSRAGSLPFFAKTWILQRPYMYPSSHLMDWKRLLLRWSNF